MKIYLQFKNFLIKFANVNYSIPLLMTHLKNIPPRFIPKIYILMAVVIGIGATSCSTTRHTTKRAEYERSHSNRRDHTKTEKSSEKDKNDLSKHLKGDEKKIIHEAQTWIGTPYKYAHQEKGKASDCSGFVMKVFEEALELKLPRNSAKQAEFCRKIRRRDVKPGDLVFFATGKDPNAVSHVGIMVDETNFLHISSSKGCVLSNIESNYYAQRLLLFGRVPDMKH